MKRLLLLLITSPAIAGGVYTEDGWDVWSSAEGAVDAASLEDCRAKIKAQPLPVKKRTQYCRLRVVTTIEPDVPVPPDPVPEPPKPVTGKPNATNTGPKGELRKVGSLNLTKAGEVVENVEATSITISAPNVTVRNFRVTGGMYGVRPTSSGTVLEDGEIVNSGSAGIYGKGFTARRMNIHHMAKDAVKAQTDVVIEDSYIHELGSEAGSHSDGVQMVNGGRVIIRRNNFDMDKSQRGFSNSQCMLFKNDSGPIDNVLVEDNWLNGGGYCVQSRTADHGTPTNVVVRNNKFGKGYQFGPVKFDGSVKACGNTWEADGKALDSKCP